MIFQKHKACKSADAEKPTSPVSSGVLHPPSPLIRTSPTERNEGEESLASQMPLRVVILGKPNVGKSTLFNRLVGKRLALVEDRPGVTHDRLEETTDKWGFPLTVTDTAGLDSLSKSPLAPQMWDQAQRGIQSAHIILFVIDAFSGLTSEDHFLAKHIRKMSKSVILIGNKCEGNKRREGSHEAYRLGFGDTLFISAAHGDGIPDLIDAMRTHFTCSGIVAPSHAQEDKDASLEPLLNIAILGRPNVGKSTLINRLMGEDRLLTGPEAGVTRDAIGISWVYKRRSMRLVDTAGLRRKSKITDSLEKLSTHESLKALRYCHIAILVLDAEEALEKQDCLLASHILDEGRGLVLALNKWDRIQAPNKFLQEIQAKLETILTQGKGMPVLPISAHTGFGIHDILDACLQVETRMNQRIETATLNTWLSHALQNHTPPLIKGRRLKIKYITQIKRRPPTFVLFGNQLDKLELSYKRYLINSLRETFRLRGVPLRLQVRSPQNPYHKKN